MPELWVTFEDYTEEIDQDFAEELLDVKKHRPDDMYDYLDNFVSDMDTTYRIALRADDGTVTELESY